VTLPIPGQTTAVAFNPDPDTARAQANGAWLVAQTREPAELVFVNDSPSHDQQVVDLAGASVLDTGHELFHRDSGDGIACAGCHAEGGEDGRVWKFKPTGDRRTQALHVGISGTEPFHWDGDMTDLGVLMDEVFVRRMGGAHQSPDRIEALKTWLSTLTPPARFGDASSPEAVRGKALFESSDVGCVSCHSGDKHTNNQNVNVGTTEATHLLQVPSLVGIGYRAPFLHNGCAATLRDRFNPACGGGDKHGKTSGLTDTQIGDLVAYLQTL
jgi:cytochrome c peroxidase